MNSWTLDQNTYGLPDHGLVAGQSRTFTPYLGDRGFTKYGSYNPTGPIPVQCVYHWHGDVLATFRAAWEDASALAFGSVWFRISLPADFARGDRGVNQYDAFFTVPFSANLAGFDWWSVRMSLDVDASQPLSIS